MQLQNFTSLFELFATFSLAYIIIDELTENPFISLVSEKILRKYNLVRSPLEKLLAEATGYKTTIENFAYIENVVKNQTYQEDLPSIQRELQSTENRLIQSIGEISKDIRENHSTHVFVYVNCYLFIYCILLLFGAGFYATIENKWSLMILDAAFFVFFIASTLFMLMCWKIETWKKKNTMPAYLKGFEHYNGYKIAVYLIIAIAIISSAMHFFQFQCWFLFATPIAHDLLIVGLLLLPMLNYFIYIRKASNRATAILPHLRKQSDKFVADYTAELREIKKFVDMCDYHVNPKVVPPAVN